MTWALALKLRGPSREKALKKMGKNGLFTSKYLAAGGRWEDERMA